MNMNPVVGGAAEKGGRRGEWDRGLFCTVSFLQFFFRVVLTMSKTSSECEDSTAFEVNWRTALFQCNTILSLITCV